MNAPALDSRPSSIPAAPRSERRTRRSRDAVTALHYQLAHTRGLGGLSAVVLVDDAGCLVAGAGAWPHCEELAAYAPLLEDRSKISRRTVSARVRELAEDTDTRLIAVDGADVVLCGRGGAKDRALFLEMAVDGIIRILRAA